jgi:hypothetical protein
MNNKKDGPSPRRQNSWFLLLKAIPNVALPGTCSAIISKSDKKLYEYSEDGGDARSRDPRLR